MSKKTQSFNDGVSNIYSVGNIANPGDMPKEGLTLKIEALRYEERIVGMGRFWTAKQANVQIDMIIRVPKRREVSTQDIAIPNDGDQYKINQIQYIKGIEPPSMDLSLERLEANYEIA